MNCNEAGVSYPTGVLKCFVFYFIVFAVAAVLIVRASDSRVPRTEPELTKTSPCITFPISDADDHDSVLDIILDDRVFDEDSDDLSEINDPEKLYYPIIVKASKRYQVDPLLVKAIIVAESGFNPNAVSQMGAQGLMQLMPSTAKALGVKDSFNPEHNINGGVKYFKKLLDRFNGDVRLALAAYNAGSRKVHKYRGVPPFSETKNYIEKVFKLHTDFKKTESYSLKNVFLSQS